MFIFLMIVIIILVAIGLFYYFAQKQIKENADAIDKKLKKKGFTNAYKKININMMVIVYDKTVNKLATYIDGDNILKKIYSNFKINEQKIINNTKFMALSDDECCIIKDVSSIKFIEYKKIKSISINTGDIIHQLKSDGDVYQPNLKDDSHLGRTVAGAVIGTALTGGVGGILGAVIGHSSGKNKDLKYNMNELAKQQESIANISNTEIAQAPFIKMVIQLEENGFSTWEDIDFYSSNIDINSKEYQNIIRDAINWKEHIEKYL